MSEAMNIFMNSYLKKMRRPEMGGGFSPDQAFGANLVHGSESLNPDAIRDRTNAQYGSMKSLLQQGPSMNLSGIGGAQNMPFMGGNQNTPFVGSMNKTPVMDTAGAIAPNILSPWLSDKLKELVKEKPGEMLSSTMNLPAETPTEVMMSTLKPQSFGVESGLGGYEGVGQEFTKDIPMPSSTLESGSMLEGFDPSSLGITAAASAAPKLMELLSGSKTVGNAAGTATSTGLAAAQGFTNPVSDLAAVYSLYKLVKGLF